MADTSKQIITVKVSAGARTEVVEEIAPYILKIRTQAPPEKGKANARVAELIAEYYGISPSDVTLLRGATNREKIFTIDRL